MRAQLPVRQPRNALVEQKKCGEGKDEVVGRGGERMEYDLPSFLLLLFFKRKNSFFLVLGFFFEASIREREKIKVNPPPR